MPMWITENSHYFEDSEVEVLSPLSFEKFREWVLMNDAQITYQSGRSAGDGQDDWDEEFLVIWLHYSQSKWGVRKGQDFYKFLRRLYNHYREVAIRWKKQIKFLEE